VLPLLTAAQLQTATEGLGPSNGLQNRDSPERQGRSSPPVLNKKTGIEYWENFPLDTVDNIRRWQQDCALHGQLRDDLTSTVRSRPGSVEQPRQNGVDKISGLSHFRSISTDSFASASQDYDMQPSQQSWNSLYHIPPKPVSNSEALLLEGFSDQSWPAHPNGMSQLQQTAQLPLSNGGLTEVNTGLFSSEVQRRLFW